MRYLAIAIATGLATIVSGCTTSYLDSVNYLGSAGTYEPGYRYTGYGPAYLGQTGLYGLSPGTARVQRSDRARLARDNAEHNYGR
ncbi:MULTISPECIES: hypothetical protein [unclassified Mesorhizobium]|uniref:hypothetical protein n=1 Tax=unclassified Mesorhizobium TaxID=325217 RepID=UPI0019280125|nr:MULTISPECIES: hypothetical protein [unclassified Mesorhizobium]